MINTLHCLTCFRPSTAPSVTNGKPPGLLASRTASTSAASASGPKPFTRSQTATTTSTLAKTKSNSSSNLYSGSSNKTSAKSAAVDPFKESARQNRVSLVARQAKFSANQPTARSSGAGLMTRSATSATLPNRNNRVVAFGRGGVLTSTTTSATLTTSTRTQPRQSQQRLKICYIYQKKKKI